MTDKSEFDNATTYDEKRQTLLDEMVEDIIVQDIPNKEIATRVVSMLIMCEGSINRYQECIELMIDVIERVARERINNDVNPST